MQNNILKNYIESRPENLTELAKLSGIDKARLSRAQNSKRLSTDITLELLFALKQPKVSIKGIENGKEVFLNLEIKR